MDSSPPPAVAGLWTNARRLAAAIDRLRERVPNPIPPRVEAWVPRLALLAAVAVLVLFIPVGLYRITWDTPGEMSYDGALYTDEGLYSWDAITWYLEGAWYTPNEFNQYITLPLLQYMQAGAFVVFGLSLATVRVLNFAFTLSWLAAAYMLYRHFLGWKWALGGAALIAINHVTFGMSRFALAEMPMAMFATWSVVCALAARGRFAYGWAALCALLFSAAVLTKLNAMFLAPVVAVIMVAVDARWRPVAGKFALCTVVFLIPTGLHWWFVVRPHPEEFAYFFSLNVANRSSLHPLVLATGLWGVYRELQPADPVLMPAVFLIAGAGVWLGAGRRRHPLPGLLLLWYAMYSLLFAYYGRIYLRFFPVSFVATHGLVLWAMWTWWHTRRAFNFVPFYGVAALLAVSTFGNVAAIRLYVFDAEDTYNAMAADVGRLLDADPAHNRVVMGHHAGSLALRVPGLIPRHDRYGLVPIERRLLIHRPGWYTCEIPMRFHKFHSWYQHHEWIERLFDVDLVGTYYILRNRHTGEVYRGYPVVLYHLTPREEEMRALAQRPDPTRPAVVPK